MKWPAEKRVMDLENKMFLKKLIESSEIGVLAVKNCEDGVSTYPMVILSFELDCTLWFFVNVNGKTAECVSTNPNVGFHIHDSKTHRSLGLEGTAQLEQDNQRAYHYWDPRFRSWFPGGPNDEDLRLLRIKVERAHMWDAPKEVPLTITAAFVSTIRGEADQLEHEVVFESESNQNS